MHAVAAVERRWVLLTVHREALNPVPAATRSAAHRPHPEG